MATAQQPKKVVQSNVAPAETKSNWQPRPEDRAKANQYRWIAVAFWVVAIAVECVVIFGLLLANGMTRTPADGGASETVYPFFGAMITQNALFIWCIVLIVVCGVLAIIGSQFWKKANKIDPASEKDKFRFFVQNQLGAIISVIAFLPLVILVLLSKNLQGAQKGIVAAVAIVVLGASVAAGVETNPASSEQYGTEQSLVMAYNQAKTGTATDEVFWVKGSKVYHLCSDAGVLNLSSKDPNIYSGTVGQAHAAGMSRLTLQTECDFNPSTNTIVSSGQVLDVASAPQPLTPSDTPS